MSEPESSKGASPRRPRRLLWCGLGFVALLAVAAVGLYEWASSASFEAMMRARLIAVIETATGGRVEIASFHWHLADLEAEADGLVLHGREAGGETPYASIGSLRVRLSLLGLWSPRIRLRSLDASHPGFHLIVYPDGSTNQPQPRKPARKGKSSLDTFFQLQAGRISVEQGVLDVEDRAAAFDFQERRIPLDFAASDVSLEVGYAAADAASPERYRIEAAASAMKLTRGKTDEARADLRCTLDLTRSAINLRSLRITSKAKDRRVRRGIFAVRTSQDRTLEISGQLDNFARPRWRAKLAGDLDMELLNPVFGYPDAPEGVASLDLEGAGQGGEFRADGGIHIEGGSYIGTGVVATGVRLDARLHADPALLRITSIVARLRQGGQLEGELALTPWLHALPGTARMDAAKTDAAKMHTATPGYAKLWPFSKRRARAASGRGPATPPPPPAAGVPMNGTVTAHFKDVALDSVLDMVSQQPFLRLGLDTRLNGPVTATWTNGDQKTVAVAARFDLSPSRQPVAGETPATGLIDATYTQHDGAVDLRRLSVHTPASELEAFGRMGAYPMTSPSALDVEFHSHNLNEFDTVLVDLGLHRRGQSGTAALPIALTGQLDFLHGFWTGSLVEPRIQGSLKATQLSIEMLPLSTPGGSGNSPQPVAPKFVTWDTVEASGSYAPERIVIERSRLRRGNAELSLEGSLAASSGPTPSFDANSILHARLRAAKVKLEDWLALSGQNLPLAGTVEARLDADGPLHAPGGAGWVQLTGGSAYGEPIARLSAEGSLDNRRVHLTSMTVGNAAGQIAASGSLDLNSRRMEWNAHSASIDLARIEWQRSRGMDVSGKLDFTAQGSGTLDDPRLEARATLSPLVLGGESLGAVTIAAHTQGRALFYDASTRLDEMKFDLNGQTTLGGDYQTQAQLDFSQFNIGALLKMAHVESVRGESALAGTVHVEGPLARPEQLRGVASLKELLVTLAGVRLESQGGVHATLADGRIRLDPLHVTGDDTDLRMNGSLALTGKQQLDLAASGSVNLKLAETLDPDLTASGTTSFQVEAHGPLKSPDLRGRIEFQNGSLSLEDIPNGLSQLRGALEFNQNRLEVKSLTAMTGGGQLSIAGSLAYQHGIYADLSITGNGVRIRYPQGVSSLANAALRLQGSQNNLLLGGDVQITRFSVSPDLDIVSLAAQAGAAQAIAPPGAPSSHVRLDVHVLSSPQLNFQNAYAKLAGDVDLRLRGTVATPSLLGRVSITEGSATIAGTRYDLQSGDISFTNPVRIEPNIDLNATARVEDYDITLGLHGTPDKLAVNYRSDPPLAEADVVALLALGRTGSQQRLYTQQQQQSLANPTTDALLGGALNATVSSRVQKLFGAGSVKLDPNYLGALGNSTSRIIVEEQFGRNLTLTYATNVNTTQQQLIQAEVAINRHVSLVVARDESGVFSMVVKATRRFR